jgi:lysozyme
MNSTTKKVVTFSAAGLIALATWEGFESNPYKDIGGVWTDGFGNTNQVVPNKVLTVPQALDRLNKNVNEFEATVNRCITQPTTQGQYDAFVKFSFNVGSNAFCKSTLVKKFNSGDSAGACNELSKWVFVKGRRVQGLVNRREAERSMCLS